MRDVAVELSLCSCETFGLGVGDCLLEILEEPTDLSGDISSFKKS